MNRERKDQIEQEAAEFLARTYADDATEADWLALETWLAKDSDHRAAFDRAEALWLEVGEAAAEIIPSLTPDAPGDKVVVMQPRVPRRQILFWGGAVAAALAVTVFGAGSLGVFGGAVDVQTYATRAGETREIVLADGSKLAMNGASHITVRISRRERHVTMDDAEVSFDVAHDAARPFLVDVGDRQVRVVGTEFNIGRRDDLTVVTVRRGVVEVHRGDVTPHRLTAGKRLSAVDGRAEAVIEAVNPDNAFAWRAGRLVYDDRPISEVAADLSRRFPTPVKLDASAAGMRFTGVLMLDDEASVLRRLEGLAPIKAEQAGSTIILRRAPN